MTLAAGIIYLILIFLVPLGILLGIAWRLEQKRRNKSA